MRVIGALIALLVGALCVASTQSAQREHETPTATAPPENGANKDFGPPWACPVYPMYTDGNNVTWYYANLHFSNQCDNPLACYLSGNLDYPHPCPKLGCLTAYRGTDKRQGGFPNSYPNSLQRFDGLEACVSEDYVHDEFPEGTAKDLCTASELASIKFIVMRPFGRSQPAVVAKLNRVRVKLEQTDDAGETFLDTYLAFEMDHYPNSGWTWIADDDVAPAWPRESHAFMAKTLLDEKEINILVLLANQPPILNPPGESQKH